MTADPQQDLFAGPADDNRPDEADRLWAAIRRDLCMAIEEHAGFRDGDKAARRLERAWARLCALDIGVATRLYHGIGQVHSMSARHDKADSPAACFLGQLREVAGLAAAGRAANPGAEAATVGELAALGEQAVRDEVDRETGSAAQ